jgi:hypothetical protein
MKKSSLNHKRLSCLSIGLLLGLSCLPAFGQDMSSGNPPPPPDGSSSGSGHPRQPPAEAFTACNGKSAGDSVTITTPDGRSLTGTCVKFGDRLAARPSQPPPRQ